MAQHQASGELEGGVSALSHWINQFAQVLHEGLARRIAHIGAAPADWAAFVGGMEAQGRSAWVIGLYALAAVIGGALALVAMRRFMAHRAIPLGPVLRGALAILLAGVLVVIASRIVTSDVPTRRLVILWGCASIIAFSCRHILGQILTAGWAPARARGQLRVFRELISLSFMWAIAGLAVISTIRELGASRGLVDLFSTLVISAPVTALFVAAYLIYRQPVTAAVAGPPPRTVRRLRFAVSWPYLAIAAALGTFTALQIAITINQPLPGLPMMLTLLLLLLAPHIDSTLSAWSRAREEACASIPRAAIYRTSRPAFILVTLLALGSQWAYPALSALGVRSDDSEWRTLSLALVALVSAWAWNLTDIGFERLSQRKARGAAPHDDEIVHKPHSRLETLFPLLAGTARTLILLIALLTILLLLGMNVWPIITGLSVFGLAISFGSQTLVKDIVSGLFFLIDDAFRMGEYIETSGVKGTVERISIRSVSLRHPRGAVATIPYGQIGKIQNYSRDWVIDKLVFRVAFDTDVEKVRKLFKQIGARLAEDPDFKDDLLQTFKSQGIFNVEDGTLLVRGKYMARAGKQFGIRKRVYLEVQKAFRENGIVAVPKPMMVAGPPGAGGEAKGAIPAQAAAAPAAQAATAPAAAPASTPTEAAPPASPATGA